jgi:quercetin dioxygenase-like cupin family protein
MNSPPHTHPTITTHLVVKGKITLQEEGKKKQTYKKGDRADVGANVEHEAWIGDEVQCLV